MTVITKRFLTTREAAQFLGLAANTLEQARIRGVSGSPGSRGGKRYGPSFLGRSLPFVKMGKAVRYDIADLEQFAAQGKQRSTSESSGVAA